MRSGISPILVDDWERISQALDLSGLQGKTLLLTGATGLIGRYVAGAIGLANQRRDLGCRVIALTRRDPQEPWGALPGVESRLVDLRRPFELPDRVDYIFHAACPATPAQWFNDRLVLVDLNVDATRRLLEVARRDGAAMLFCSSIEIYGNLPPGMLAVPESFGGSLRSTDARAIYGESKRMGEVIGIAYREDFGVRSLAARIGHLYGPGIGLDDTRVFADFMRQALAGQPIRLKDQGRALKSFGYVADAVVMLLKVLLSGTQPIYNIGGRRQVTIRDLAAQIADLAGGPGIILPEMQSAEGHIGTDAQVPALDLGLFTAEFGDAPSTELADGLARMIAWNRR